ncbi:sister chromatid cohesion and DNA repair protein [Amniculicola lignicola CBS 123094]|uniref:Sister chromatid cohesion and DNA repair protein n=1 Tax=Amniculicola lignicola CBS 123094 TaxID=1392246 RepID=A0A6A5WVQ0_9PLEO|nr:sister chromatid cohesion and DNA repair protein [Amniculicola lignicola CBS 123094]
MAPRSRRSAATEVVEEEEEQENVQGLVFNKTLLGKPGRPINVGELLSRLKALCDELRGLEQEEADRESLVPVAKELMHQSLLQHKDAGVRAWTACCIVDMFRLCAPDAPYTATQLKDIFTLIISKLLPLLADPSNPYNSQHLYVLRCLAEVKSIILLTDIPSSAHLTSVLFTTCFDVLSGPSKAESGEELSRNVEHHMTIVLSILIDEAPSLSPEIVDVILAQFLWADPITLGASGKGKKNAAVDNKQSTLLRKEAPPAYNMAKNICNACPDKMARLIGNYFSSVIVDFTSGGSGQSKNRSRHRAGSDPDDSGDEVAKGPSDDELNDANKAHRLLRELWKCAPGVLQDIVPHLQEELGTENVQLRQLATETFGDMISGIGAAGPPPLPELNPAAYPSQSLDSSTSRRPYNFLTTPTSTVSFSSQYPAAYEAFLQRKHDKSAIIRSSWTTGIGRILMTSAGGVGLDSEEEQRLLKNFAECLIDGDERVRLAAVRAVEHFEFNDIVLKLGSNGSVSEPGSVLSNLADRVKDKRSVIHLESMKLLGKIWGVAAGAIAEGNERITNLLEPIPSRILDACYVNDAEINAQVDLTLYESLLPLSYPPMKARAATNGSSQVVKDSQANGDQGYTEAELDKLRVERQLVLVNGLQEKAKKVFFAKQANQAAGATYMHSFLSLCESYNGGVMDKGEKETEKKLGALISYYAKTLPDQTRASEELWKFAKAHDRRSYALIRFSTAPESDYRKVFRSLKEFRKRFDDVQSISGLQETMTTLVYRASLLCYNKSHVPAIIEYSRTDENGLAAAAHEVLKEISTRHPKVFSTHVKDLCKTLESETPTSKHPNPPGAVDNLKACAGFAKKFPKDVPVNSKENRKLIQSFINFALYGSPPKAAKHAITIIMSSDDKKEQHAKEILSKSLKDFEYGGDHFLTKLAALSQLVLLGPAECANSGEKLIDIAVNGVLLRAHTDSPETEVEWMEEPDEEMLARTWALKIIVNRLRSFPEDVEISEVASPVYKLLNRMVKNGGEASAKSKTPLGHKNFQRLLAAKLLLKLSCIRRLDSYLSPADFNELALVLQDSCIQIRQGFAKQLMKYLGQNRLPTRFYSILFLLAYEPNQELNDSATTWIRSRRSVFASRKEITLETIMPRVLSLLAHHPDFEPDSESLKVMSKYIIFYLKSVATQDNLSLIFHMAQRAKGVADGIVRSEQADQNLYILSDLAQALIRIWEEHNGWSLQSYPGKLKLPAGIFRQLESHEKAQDIADKVWIEDDLVEELEPIVRSALRSKKRKAHTDGETRAKKKVKSDKKERVKVDRPVKTPKRKKRKGRETDDEDGDGRVAPSSEPKRKSDRRSGLNKSYIELDSDIDEDDAEAGAEQDDEDEDSEQGSPEPEPASDDVEMADAEAEAEVEPEPEEAEASEEEEPSPPPKKTPRGKATKKSNGVAAQPKTKRAAPEPAKASKPTPKPKGRTRTNGHAAAAVVDAPSSPAPAANGTVRRSARSRA